MLYDYLRTGKKISKDEANYRELQNNNNSHRDKNPSCDKCKFNLPAEQTCHIVDGNVNNENGISKYFAPRENGISKYFAPRENGMLPGDIVWDFIKKVVIN